MNNIFYGLGIFFMLEYYDLHKTWWVWVIIVVLFYMERFSSSILKKKVPSEKVSLSRVVDLTERSLSFGKEKQPSSK